MTDKEQKKTKKRKVRNKARDALSDYYISNRYTERENRKLQEEQAREKREKGEKQGWSSNEKIYLAVIIIGLIGIFIRYVIF